MSQGAGISQPSDSMHLCASAHCDGRRKDGRGLGWGAGEVWGEMEYKIHEGRIRERVPNAFI